MVEIISSEQNQKIKILKKLYNRKNRRKKGKFVLEGYRIIDEALKSKTIFDNIYMSPDFYNSEQGQSLMDIFQKKYDLDTLVIVKKKLLNKISATNSSQGVVGVVNEIEYELREVFFKKEILLLLDRIQDPGNMGTIIRTAVAAGVDGIIILKGSVDIYNLKVLRATMGAIFKIPLIQNISLDKFFYLFNNNRYKLISTDLSAEKYYHKLDYREPSIIAIGNEANGLQEKIIANSDYTIKIPVIGEIDSLNAAIATGIILYKVLENRWE